MKVPFWNRMKCLFGYHKWGPEVDPDSEPPRYRHRCRRCGKIL